MSNQESPSLFDTDRFNVQSFDDEVRVDTLCTEFLNGFYLDLVEVEKLDPKDASTLAYGASYFLKEFVVPDRKHNIFNVTPTMVRQFAGNWYIIKNLEPNMVELENILNGIQTFYGYCLKEEKVTREHAVAIQAACQDTAFYKQRIEDFWSLENDGYSRWHDECPI